MDTLFASIASVALAEIGDKTQLLALFLATRFTQKTQKTQIILGIFIATVINHALSAWLGVELVHWLPEGFIHWFLGLSFIAVGIWLLIPDKDDNQPNSMLKYGAFCATFILFFFAEIGDKTQVATILLGAHYQSVWLVLWGSTIGMMIANVPMIFAGQWIMQKVRPELTRRLACLIFLSLGIASLLAPTLSL